MVCRPIRTERGTKATDHRLSFPSSPSMAEPAKHALQKYPSRSGITHPLSLVSQLLSQGTRRVPNPVTTQPHPPEPWVSKLPLSRRALDSGLLLSILESASRPSPQTWVLRFQCPPPEMSMRCLYALSPDPSTHWVANSDGCPVN